MSKTFVRVDHIDELSDALIEYHHRLVTAGVTFSVLMVFSETDDYGQPVAPPIKLHGVPASAMVKANPLKLRALGLGDVEMQIDGHRWEIMTHKERMALLDHELTHIELIPTKDGKAWELDDLGRPRITMRRHDFQYGWFIEVAERHGKASQEVQQARQVMQSTGQLFFDFGTELNQSRDKYLADRFNNLTTDQIEVVRGAVQARLDEEKESTSPDPLYDAAVQFVTESGTASISAVQRQFRIGYNRAARIVEAMEGDGVVSEMNAWGQRTVLDSQDA